MIDAFGIRIGLRFCGRAHTHAHARTCTHSAPTSREPITGLPWARLSLEAKVLTALIQCGQWQVVVFVSFQATSMSHILQHYQ